MEEASARMSVEVASAAYALGDNEIKMLTEVTLLIARMEAETARFGPGFRAVIDNPAVHFGVSETVGDVKQREKLNVALEAVLEDLQQHGPTLSLIGEERILPIASYLAIMRWQDSAPEKTRKIRRAWLRRTQTMSRDFPLQQTLYAMQTVFGENFTAQYDGDPARLSSRLLQIAGIDKTPEQVASIWKRLLRSANE